MLFTFKNKDSTSLALKAKESNIWNSESIFQNLQSVSDFFEKGSVGFSPNENNFDGLELKTKNWKVSLLEIEHVQSSFFNNEEIFPKDSIKFDNALLMKDIEHEWVDLGEIRSK